MRKNIFHREQFFFVGAASLLRGIISKKSSYRRFDWSTSLYDRDYLVLTVVLFQSVYVFLCLVSGYLRIIYMDYSIFIIFYKRYYYAVVWQYLNSWDKLPRATLIT